MLGWPSGWTAYFVVCQYSPPGNVLGQFQQNVYPPISHLMSTLLKNEDFIPNKGADEATKTKKGENGPLATPTHGGGYDGDYDGDYAGEYAPASPTNGYDGDYDGQYAGEYAMATPSPTNGYDGDYDGDYDGHYAGEEDTDGNKFVDVL